MRDRYERPGGRRDLVVRLLEERPWCEARVSPRCSGRSVDVNERLTRARGGSILNEENLVTVCRRCHDWIHGHPVEAESLGLLVWSWDANRHGGVG
jgi:hypothetical protein